MRRRTSATRNMPRSCTQHCRWMTSSRSMRPSWTSQTPRRNWHWRSTSGAAGTRPRPAPIGLLVQQNSQRDALLAALNINIFARHATCPHGQHCADGQRAAGNDPYGQGKMLLTPTYHVFRMYVPFQDAKYLPLQIDAARGSTVSSHCPGRCHCGNGRAGRLLLAFATWTRRAPR